jgi:hypothetical protein
MRALLLLVAAAPIAVLGQVSSGYDRFTGKTELWAPSMDVVMKTAGKGKLTPQAFTNFRGAIPERPPLSFGVAFRVVSKAGWEYLNCHDVDALVGGKPFALPQPRHDGSAHRGAEVFESVLLVLSTEEFAALARGPTEFRVCRTEVRLTDRQLEDWRALLRMASPKK